MVFKKKNIETETTEEVKTVETVKEEKPKDEKKVIGTIWGTAVKQGQGFIKTKVYRGTIPMYILPDELRQYLQNKGFWTNVWEKSKEWLEKHHADMDKINELKKFISDRYH